MSPGVDHPIQCALCLVQQSQSSFSPSLEHLKKPASELLMNSGEGYRKIQEEREAIDRALPTQHDRKVRKSGREECGC